MTRAGSLVLAWALGLGLCACGGGSGSDTDGGDDAGRDGGADASPDDGGGTDDAATDDAGPDDAGPDDAATDDAGPDDAGDPDACVPESDSTLCDTAGAECGSLDATDRCGADRLADCGDCPGLQTCGARGTAHRCNWESWDIETVDDEDDAGLNLAMTLGPGGRPWIAYRASDTGDALRVARLEADDSWTVDTLDETLLIAHAIAIALDPEGDIQVFSAPASSDGGSDPKIDVHIHDGSGWTRDPVGAGSSPEYLGVAFDADGDRHFCAYQAPSGGFGGYLEHMEETSPGTFDTTTVDGAIGSSTSDVGDYCSIAIDAGGDLHMSYDDANFGVLRYAIDDGSGWTEETVDDPDGDSAGDYTDMDLDPSGAPVISYRAGSALFREIRVATDGASGWTLDTVEPEPGIIANHTAIDVDGAGTAHLSYFDSTDPGLLHYAHEDGSGGWTLEEVAVMGTGSGGYNDIVVGDDGVVHIAFYDARTGSLRYARRVE